MLHENSQIVANDLNFTALPCHNHQWVLICWSVTKGQLGKEQDTTATAAATTAAAAAHRPHTTTN